MRGRKRLFEPIGPEITGEEKIARLTEGFNCYWSPPEGWPEGVDYEPSELSPEDEAIVRSCLSGQAAEVRQEAVSILGGLGPVTWDDLKAWLLDPAEEVRMHAESDATLPSALGRLCDTGVRCFLQTRGSPILKAQ